MKWNVSWLSYWRPLLVALPVRKAGTVRGGDPKITRIFKIVYFSEHFQNLIAHKKLSLRINTLIPPLFPLFKTVLGLLQSDSLQCLRRFLPHLLYILKTLLFKVPLHSWKQEKIAGCQVRGVGGVCVCVWSRCHPVFREKLPHTQCCVGRSTVVMQKPLTWPPQFGSFSSHSITQSPEHFKVKLLVSSLTLWYEFKVDEPFDVKEADQHGFHIWFDLPRLFWSRRWCTFPLTWLLLCLRVVPITPWFISCDHFGQNVWISFQLIFQFTAHIQTTGSLILREQARNEFRSNSFHVKFFC